MKAETVTIGKRGIIVIPSALRKRFRLHEGDLLITEDYGNGILIVPAVAIPVETYSVERKAEFILSNAIDKDDYQKACKEVIKLGLDPNSIKHHNPSHH